MHGSQVALRLLHRLCILFRLPSPPANLAFRIQTCSQDPIDLASIEKRLQRGTYYVALDIFVADVRRIFSNCRIYNAPESIYHKAGNNLEAVLDEFLYSRLVIEDPTPAMQ